MALIRQDEEGLYVIAGGLKARPGAVNGYAHAYPMDDGGLVAGEKIQATHVGGSELVRLTLPNGEKRWWFNEGESRNRDLIANLSKPLEKEPIKVAIVKFSDLGDRLDAGFHIVRERLKSQTARIISEMQMDDILKEAKAAFTKMPPAFRKCLNPLMRTGGNHAPTIEQYERAIAEYPPLSLAIMREKYEDVQQHYENLAREATENSQFFRKGQ